MHRAPRGPRRPAPAARRPRAQPLPAPGAAVDAEFDGGQRHRRLDDDGLHPPAAQPDPRPGARQADRARSSRTRRAPSAWTRCSRRSASTPPTASATTPVDSDLVLSYRESIDGQVLEEGINEAGSMASLPGRRHVVRHARRADDPVLHLLLDVRVPADRRPGVGVRRPARARVHDRRHGRAARRSPARASSTTTATPRSSPRRCPVVRAYDPAFAYELAAVIRDGIERHVRATARTSSTTSPSTTRTTPQPAKPEGVDEGIIRGIYRFAAAPDDRRRQGPRPARRLGLDPAAGARGARPPRRAVRHRRRGLLGDLVPAAPPRGAAGGALEPAPPGQGAARPVRGPGAGPDGGPVVVATDWIKTLPDLVAPWVAGARTSCWARTASGAATPARPCGPTSRSTPPNIAGGGALRARPRCGEHRRAAGGRSRSASWASTRRRPTR